LKARHNVKAATVEDWCRFTSCFLITDREGSERKPLLRDG
jgi:hypothetical protein